MDVQIINELKHTHYRNRINGSLKDMTTLRHTPVNYTRVKTSSGYCNKFEEIL